MRIVSNNRHQILSQAKPTSRAGKVSKRRGPKRWTKRVLRKIESEAQANNEDAKRIADALVAMKADGNRAVRRAVKAVIRKIEGVIEGDPDGSTLASKTTMRGIRKKWVRHILKLFRTSKGYPISFGTLMPKSLEIHDEGLESLNPEAVKKAFISYLNRRGINKCRGWLIACLHGEYDSINSVWRIHWHLLVCGEMIKVIDGLRNDKDFKSAKGEAARVRMTRKPITDIKRVASYLLQSWWPNRPKGKFAKDGIDHRKNRSRLPKLQQTRWLLWMDQRKLSDLVMLRGARRTGSGFKVTKL